MGLKSMNLGDTKPAEKNVIQLYHGSPYREFTPVYGKGKDNHDYGRGFYLTPDKELAREWAVGGSRTTTGWVHSYELNLDGLVVLNFEEIKKQRALCWVTELLQHREPDEQSRGIYYEDYKAFLTSHFGLDSSAYDVVSGWRADDSYFKIVSELLDDHLQTPLLEEALRLGNLGIQYCCRSQKSFAQLTEFADAEPVPLEYRERYKRRDLAGRQAFFDLINSTNNRYGRPTLFMRDLLFHEGGKP